jgi:hypothetical protein
MKSIFAPISGVTVTLGLLVFAPSLALAAPPAPEAAPAAEEAPVEEAQQPSDAPAEPPAPPAPPARPRAPAPMQQAAPPAAPPGAYPPGYYPPPPGTYPPGYYPPPPGAYPPGAYGPEYPPPPGAYPPPPPGYYAYPPPPLEEQPSELPYEEGDPIPEGYEPVTKMRKGLVIAGSVVFGSTYLISIITAAQVADVAGTTEDVWPLFVPVVGPFIAMGTTHAWSDGEGSNGLGAILLLDGIAQVGGAAMFIGGVASHTTVLKRTASSDVQVDLELRPNGVGFSGTF